MKIRSFSTAFVLTLPLAACHSSPPKGPTPEAASKQTVSCTVCEHEGDLACAEVELKADTPEVTLNGTRYYFCSEECRDEFLQNPKRYTH